MPMGPPLSSRQVPYMILGLGIPFLTLGLLVLFASLGLLSSEFSAPVFTEAVLLGQGGLYVSIAIFLFRKHARLVPGTKAYEEFHRQKDWHVHVTQGSVAYWVGFGALLAGFTLLGVVEGSQGRCYRGAPNACLFSLSPAAGWEFWGTLLVVGGPTGLLGFGVWKLIEWRRNRVEERSVQSWLDGEGPLELK